MKQQAGHMLGIVVLVGAAALILFWMTTQPYEDAMQELLAIIVCAAILAMPFLGIATVLKKGMSAGGIYLLVCGCGAVIAIIVLSGR